MPTNQHSTSTNSASANQLPKLIKPSRDHGLKTALTESFKTVHLPRKQVAFWLCVLVFASALVFLAKNAKSLFADSQVTENVDVGNNTYTVNIDIAKDGQTFVNDRPVYRVIRPLGDLDEIRYKVLDRPGGFIDKVEVNVHFAGEIPENAVLKSYAVHGIDSSDEAKIDAHTIRYNAYGVGPEATYTVTADLAAGSINWPWWLRIATIIGNLPVGVWLGLSVALPFLAVIVLLVMFGARVRAFVKGEPNGEIEQPPVNLPPAIAGILINGKVSAREIAATLLDLANRGYITIYDKGEGKFSFAKRRPWQDLQSFELTLLSQLFDQPGYKADQQDIEVALGGSLFSRKISKVYVAMYDTATSLGYFEKQPLQVHGRYRFTGLLLFFIGLISFGLALALQIQPPFIIFFFAGLMAMALVIIFTADSVPLWTKQGELARRDWLAFRNYLASPGLIGYIEGAQQYYQRFLPYAVVTRTEVNWVHRFQNFPFRVPDWYGSVADYLTIEDFANGLYRIVGTISQIFANAREPGVN